MRPARIIPLAIAFACFHGGSAPASLANESSQQKWAEYHDRSQAAALAQTEAMNQELRQAGLSEPLLPPSGSTSALTLMPDEWYQSERGLAITEAILSFQTPSGGWAKGIDVSRQRQAGETYGPEPKYTATFDNKATIAQLGHLARAFKASGDKRAEAGFRNGFQFVLAAQYPNGGWPQIYPLVGGYHDLITYNDGAMTNVMDLLRGIVQQEADFLWLDDRARAEAERALQLALQCVLNTQIQVEGRFLAWAQQYDPISLTPAPARAYEPISLASSESADVLTFLLKLDAPDADIIHAIEAATRWFEETRIEGAIYDKAAGRLAHPVADGDAVEMWARFYEIGSNRPLFGDRDGSVHYDLAEVSLERRKGYAWYVTDPKSALRRFDKWLTKRAEN